MRIYSDFFREDEFVKAFEILKILKQYGKAYIVGGAVRDILLSIRPKDIDIATNVPVEKIKELFTTYEAGTNEKFGVILVRYKEETFEVCAFRKDGAYTDGRRPDEVIFTQDFKEEASRRDFTINAMALNIFDFDGEIIDYFGGIEDLNNKIIRCVGNPYDRFNEDKLRMLRAIRFANKLDFKLDPDLFQAIKDMSSLIKEISAERIYDELKKMGNGRGCVFADAIVLLKKTGLLEQILPEINALENLEHNPEYHPESLDVLGHTIEALKYNTIGDYVINFAILFHDIGKLTTQSQNADFTYSYNGHAEAGVPIFEEISYRLKMDNDTREAIAFAIENHMKIHHIQEMRPNKIIKLLQDKNFDIFFRVAECDTLARGTKESFDEFKEKADFLYKFKDKYIDRILDTENIADKMKKIVNGNLIMSVKGLTKGSSQVGKWQEETIDWIVKNNIDLENIAEIRHFISTLK
jgi:tRNA nucleotidyltransferase/poly(A) polymerase